MPTPQAPIHSGFGATTTARQALAGRDLAGWTVIVTGGYSGLGLETTRVMAAAGATVIVPARTPDKARHALQGIERTQQGSIDLLDPASIHAFARAFLDSGRPLHALVNSAGIMATPLARDRQGNESQFSANHLGHFRLAVQLWPALRRAGGARVVSVSSRAHRISGVDFEDPNFERRPYDKWAAYGQSKSANALFAVALDTRGEEDGIRAFSLHPGVILTELVRDLSDSDLSGLGVSRDQPNGHVPPGRSVTEGGDFKTLEQGAATSVWCAAGTQLEGLGGVYCEDCDIAATVAIDDPEPSGVRPWAVDPERAERLWQLSEALTALTFTD